MKKIIAIIGARPQFIKHFPFERACRGKLDLITIHTGQHYDENMSSIFFDQLGMKRPQFSFDNGGSNHGEQTGKMMVDIERVILDIQPDGVVVYGDTNSTLAGALVAAKLHIPVYHIEAGLRSFNKAMPEEINRVLTDHISSKLFVTSQLAVDNLTKEGITENVILVGDIMKDVISLVLKGEKIGNKKYPFDYYYVTIHRPYNTDNPDRLKLILSTLNKLSKKCIISLHPRTRKVVEREHINLISYTNLVIIEPQGYFENLNHLAFSDGLITDSGGMQKEAYWLKKKCVTIRTETEWLETLTLKGNALIFNDLTSIEKELETMPDRWQNNLYGDGESAEKIVNAINGIV